MADSTGGGDSGSPKGSNLLAGAEVYLRSVLPKDYEALYLLETSGEFASTWRHRGTTPSMETFITQLWAGVLAQYIVVERSSRRPVALVSAYNANFRDGWAYIAVAKLGASQSPYSALHGLGLLVGHVFGAFGLRKLYAEVAEFNLRSFRSASEFLLIEEARLSEHVWHDGRYWDTYVLALPRARWDVWSPILLPRIQRGHRFQQPAGEFAPTRDWPSVEERTDSRSPGVLTETEFLDIIAVEFGDGAPFPRRDEFDLSATLVGDLGLDSLEVVRLLAVVESLAPIVLPDSLPFETATLGDIYHYYCVLVDHLGE